MNPRLENFIRVMIFTYLMCKLITRLYICLVTPPLPLWTDNFVPTPPNVCWTISHSLQKKLGCLSFTGCDETGSMLSRAAQWDCFGGRYRFFYWLLETCAETGSKCLTKQSHNAIPRNTDPGPVHTYSIMFENGDFFPLRLRKNARAQVAYSLSRPHENAKTKFINLHFFSSF